MAFVTKFNFNIDSLKCCYTQTNKLFEEFSSLIPHKYYEFDGYEVAVINDLNPDSKKTLTQINANVRIWDGNDYVRLGTLTLNNSQFYEVREKKGIKDFENYAFFTVDNKALYHCCQYSQEEHGYFVKSNCLPLIPPIMESLGLQFHNISRFHVAMDCNVNLIKRLRSHIKNVDEFQLWMSRREVTDPYIRLERYREMFNRSRLRVSRTPTVYIGKDDLELCGYDKTEEIESSDKHYIEEWNEFNNGQTQRFEIKVENEKFKNWLDEIGEDYSHLTFCFSQAYLGRLWLHFANKLIYFVRRSNSKRVDLLDLLDTP